MISWTDVDVAHYEEWFDSPQGAFALKMEKRLLSHLISAWPRRNQRLLEVGCGPGFFLDFFWQAGFDITGLDASQDMIRAAKRRLGKKADLHIGHAEHLPFDDNEFDVVALLTLLEFTPDPSKVLVEAARVARKGILVAFLNRFSFYYLGSGLPLPLLKSTILRKIQWFTPWSMKHMLHGSLPHSEHLSRSVLPGPMWSWSERSPGRFMNHFILPVSFGSYCATRISFYPEKPLTPIFSMTRQQGCS